MKASKTGLVTSDKRGEAFIMARFDAYTVGSQVLSIPKDPNYEFPKLPENNYIDKLVFAKLKLLRLQPSDLCTDAEFLRRASLDVIGKPPTPDEVRAFLADPAADKRDRLIDAVDSSRR